MKRTIFFAIVLTSIAPLNYGAEVVTPQIIANRFFETFMSGRNDAAVDYFMGLNPAMKANDEQIQQMKTLLSNALRLYGKPLGVEMVSVEDFTPSLQRRVYLTKHATHPLIWELYFYKAKDEWMPDQLVFVDQYQILGRKK